MEFSELELTDGYDAEEVFGDVLSARPMVSKSASVRAVRRVIQEAQRSRLPPPDILVQADSGDVGEISDHDVLSELLGVVCGDAPTFTPEASPDYPITQKLYQKFRATLPSPKRVRLDTEDTYRKYLDEKRAPYLAKLAERLSELERVVTAHVSDPYAHEYMHDTDVLGDEVEILRERAAVCGERVPLSLPPWADGKIDCWQDGEIIYCSIRVPSPDGKPRILTTSTPAARHIEEVLGYASDAGVDPVEVMGVLPVLAQILGGGSLVSQLSRAAPQMMADGAPFIARVTPVCAPDIAAVTALLQLCRKGDSRACEELVRLKSISNGEALVISAEKCLQRGLAAKKGLI